MLNDREYKLINFEWNEFSSKISPGCGYWNLNLRFGKMNKRLTGRLAAKSYLMQEEDSMRSILESFKVWNCAKK